MNEASLAELKESVRKIANTTFPEQVEYDERQAELRERHSSGGLTDPIAATIQIAITSIQNRQYLLVENVLSGLSQRVDSWWKSNDDEALERYRSARAYTHHHAALVEAAAAEGAASQIPIVVRSLESLAKQALDRTDTSVTDVLCDQLGVWAKEFSVAGREGLAAAAISSLRELALHALDVGLNEQFYHATMTLARVGEVAATRERSPRFDTQLISSWKVGEENAVEELATTLEMLTRRFTLGDSLPSNDIVLFVDALTVLLDSFLNADIARRQTLSAARGFARDLGNVSLAAAKSCNYDALNVVAFKLEDEAELARKHEADEVLETLAWHSFEVGMVAEANAREMTSSIQPVKMDDVIDRLVNACLWTGGEAISNAVSGLFERGHTSYIPRPAQRSFLHRIQTEMGHMFREIAPESFDQS